MGQGHSRAGARGEAAGSFPVQRPHSHPQPGVALGLSLTHRDVQVRALQGARGRRRAGQLDFQSSRYYKGLLTRENIEAVLV